MILQLLELAVAPNRSGFTTNSINFMDTGRLHTPIARIGVKLKIIFIPANNIIKELSPRVILAEAEGFGISPTT